MSKRAKPRKAKWLMLDRLRAQLETGDTFMHPFDIRRTGQLPDSLKLRFPINPLVAAEPYVKPKS